MEAEWGRGALPPLLEKPQHKVTAVFSEDTCRDLCLWMEHQRREGTVTTLDVGRSVDNAGHLRPA